VKGRAGEDLAKIEVETEEAAARLVKSSIAKLWSDVPEKEKKGYRMLVTELAKESRPTEDASIPLRVHDLDG
jgi:hypothetical protein